MKVAAFNGSPNEKGNTYRSLEIVAGPLRQQGIEVEIIHVGGKNIRGCLACRKCFKNKDGRCAVQDDANEFIRKAREADGILLGSPVHYSGVAGTMKSLLDRMFYVNMANDNPLRHKVGASVVAVRRTGGIAALDTLNHFLQFAEILMPTSNYWNVVHGAVPGEVDQDEEGKQILAILGENMAWLMKLVEAGKGTVPEPAMRKKVFTNFVR